MKKIRITESDLQRIVKRVIKEQIGGTNNPITTTPDSVNLYDDVIGNAPFNLANTIGGRYT